MQKKKGLQRAEASAARQFPQTRVTEATGSKWGVRGASPRGATLLAPQLEAGPVPPEKPSTLQGSQQPARSPYRSADLSPSPAKVWGWVTETPRNSESVPKLVAGRSPRGREGDGGLWQVQKSCGFFLVQLSAA